MVGWIGWESSSRGDGGRGLALPKAGEAGSESAEVRGQGLTKEYGYGASYQWA